MKYRLIKEALTILLATQLSGLAFAEPSHADAASCSDVDLSKSLGPIRDQGYLDDSTSKDHGLGWCYAYTASDLASFALGVKISATDLAISNKKKWGQLDALFASSKEKSSEPGDPFAVQGGSINAALNSAKDAGGFCPEAIIKSDHFGQMEQLDNVVSVVSLIENSPELYESGRDCARIRFATESMFTDMKLKSVVDVLKSESRMNAWYDIAQASCKNKRINLPSGIKSQNITRDDKGPPTTLGDSKTEGIDAMIRDIDKQFNQKNIVGISYDVDLLPYKQGIVGKLMASWFPLDRKTNHASVLVARHFDKAINKCEYKIRNSWGLRCSDLLNCKDGYITVDQDTLRSILGGVTYLTEPQK